MTFDEEIAEGLAVPTDGWDFSWFAGRATEERPGWGYVRLCGERLGRVDSVLDVDTGGGEVLAEALGLAERVPGTVRATESWAPNYELASAALEPFGGVVTLVDGTAAPLPFDDRTFELVTSRHPVSFPYAEAARVLAPGGTLLVQEVGAGSNRALYEFLMGPQENRDAEYLDDLRAQVAAVGLDMVRLHDTLTRVEFFDLAAVVHFLRKVLWTVPDFSVEKYDDRLRALRDHIAERGSFVCHSRRTLVEARTP
ncbi:class I SAM-dependent methyltransferase [Promicromonospora iranensis]|uniref:SAM-dependent methyltransferase n=1 Tax=Promicromonospora iranensis TaxID=1105144 RepID=A0ABU2CMG2_9MICO|nr:class I SAM-dependent methyltransferase [Promicromonospora iranensis]MDR7382529.1 SAM-dependent methyltransferase [Promicromonospora iranensis]